MWEGGKKNQWNSGENSEKDSCMHGNFLHNNSRILSQRGKRVSTNCIRRLTMHFKNKKVRWLP